MVVTDQATYILSTVAGVLVVASILKYFRRRKYNYPPGPSGVPFLGNALQLDPTRPHMILTEWSEMYGDVFRIKLLGVETVVLNSFETIYEGLVTQANEFAGRPSVVRQDTFINHVPNVAFADISPEWVYRKKTTLKVLKMYGENLENLEVISIGIIHDMLETMKQLSAKGPFDAYPLYTECTTGIVASIIFGEKFDKKTTETILELNQKLPTLVQPTGMNFLLDLIPGLRYVPNKIYGEIYALRDKIKPILDRKILEKKTEFEEGKLNSMMDGLIANQMATEHKGGKQLTDDELYGIALDSILAGSVTTSITVNCLVAILINHQNVQTRMASEIKEQLGSRNPRLKDRKNLPFTEAAILEVLRYTSISPIGIPHKTMVDTTLNGYDIPKGTQVFFNLWKLHHDPRYWEEPWRFKPERFLDEGNTLVPPDHINRKRLLPFGASRRICLGETLARNRLFLMVTSLLQHFEFHPPSANEIPPHDPRDYIAGFTIEPRPYRIKVVQRD